MLLVLLPSVLSLIPPFTLLFLSFPTHALILNKPQLGKGFTGITSNGSMLVSWISESTDPSFITLEIQNNLTLDSWEFARNVSVDLGNITRTLDDVSGNEFYFMQAVEVGNLLNVLTESPLFTVNGKAVTTTNPIPTIPTSTGVVFQTTTIVTDTSTAFQSTTTSNVPDPGSNDNTNADGNTGKKTTGAIVGGVIGGVALLMLLAAALFIWNRRQQRRHLYPTIEPLVYQPNYVQPAEDKRAKLEEVLSEKAAAEHRRDELRTNLETQQRAGGGSRPAAASASASEPESEMRLRHQIEVMSERILQLEAQQRDLEIYEGRLFGEEEESQPPPGYSVSAGSGTASR